MNPIPLCKVISSKGNPIDYRPRAHHKLFLKDRHYDYLFNAYLRCETYIHDIYDRIICDHHKYLIDNIIKDYYHNISLYNNTTNNTTTNTTTTTTSSNNIVSISCISTSLSDLDRDYLIDKMIIQLEKKLLISIADNPCTSFDSSRDILIEIGCQYYYKQTRLIETEKRRASSKTQGILKLKSNDFLINIKDKPLESLQELINIKKYNSNSNNSNNNKILVILLRHCERIDPEIFGDFIKSLSSYNGMRCHVITFHSSICPNPIPLEKSSRILMDLSLHKTVDPFEIYDDMMGRVLATRQLPISFPAPVLAWIHESFWRSNSCNSSALDRILICLSTHFQKRCSILCMFRDREWLQDMRLVTKSKETSKDKKALEARTVYTLLGYLGADDMIGTGLLLATQGSSREQEAATATNLLAASILQSKIDCTLFKCLKVTRDTFLEKSRRIEFSADIIFAAIITNVKGGSQCTLIDDLITAITQNLCKESIFNIKQLLLKLDKLFDSLINEEDLTANSDIKEVIAKIYEELQDNNFMFDEFTDILEQSQLSDKVSLNHLKKQTRLETEESSSKKPNENAIDSLTNVELLENVINDLILWLKNTLLKIQLIPRPALVPGIIDMSEESINKALKAVNSNIRLNTMKAILNPNDHIPNQYTCKRGQDDNTLRLPEPLDITLVASLALKCTSTESLYDWYDEFYKNKRLWEYEKKLLKRIDENDDENNDDNNKKRKKRTIQEVEDSKQKKESLEHNLGAAARSRFMTSVNMLETIGLIKSKPTSYLVSRSIYTFTEEE